MVMGWARPKEGRMNTGGEDDRVLIADDHAVIRAAGIFLVKGVAVQTLVQALLSDQTFRL